MRYGLVLAAVAVFMVACGGGGAAGATPKDTFDAVKKLAEKKDFGGFYDSLSAGSKKKFDEQFEGMKKQWAGLDAAMKTEMEKTLGDPTKMANAREFFVKSAEKNPDKAAEIAKATFVEAKEEGNKATVKFKIGEKDDEMKMEKVDGKWYVSLE
jgi:hypothetical protein